MKKTGYDTDTVDADPRISIWRIYGNREARNRVNCWDKNIWNTLIERGRLASVAATNNYGAQYCQSNITLNDAISF